MSRGFHGICSLPLVSPLFHVPLDIPSGVCIFGYADNGKLKEKIFQFPVTSNPIIHTPHISTFLLAIISMGVLPPYPRPPPRN